MADLSAAVFTSSDYKIALSVNNTPFPLTIVESFDYGAKKEHEYVHIIGSDEPVAVKTNTSTYPGKITMEAGELEALLISQGYVFATQIKNATISIVTFQGDIIKFFKSCVITSHDSSVKAKDKRSLVSLSFESIGAVGI